MVQEYMFESFDGTELYGKTDSVADPRGVVVIVHGLCEHQGRYDYLTMRLNAQGYSVYRFDHRGHGRSKGTKVFYSAFDEIAKDIDVVVDRAIAENPESPLFIVGHSMGGYGATKLGLRLPERYAAIASLSGALEMENDYHMRKMRDSDRLYQELLNIFGTEEEFLASDNCLTRLAEQLDPAKAPRMYVACGTADFLFDSNEDFIRRFGEKFSIHYTTEEGAAHTWDFWDRQIEKVLAWLNVPEAE